MNANDSRHARKRQIGTDSEHTPHARLRLVLELERQTIVAHSFEQDLPPTTGIPTWNFEKVVVDWCRASDDRELKPFARSVAPHNTLDRDRIGDCGNETEIRVKNEKRESILPLDIEQGLALSLRLWAQYWAFYRLINRCALAASRERSATKGRRETVRRACGECWARIFCARASCYRVAAAPLPLIVQWRCHRDCPQIAVDASRSAELLEMTF